MKTVLWCIVALYAICQANAAEIWKTEGFENFRMGTVGNAGQNIYISKSGLLQRIHHSDINLDGEVDLLFCNSQGHEEYVHPVAY